ncbi:MAG: hypothetical protein KKB66_02485 [Alphaproteobacteria bacterium]|nr:hypothetical protein [Alphaproteobacteria bacterium]
MAFREERIGGQRKPSTDHKIIDAVEALANACIGIVVSWVLTMTVLGYGPAQSAAVTAMFFVASFTRAWAIRAIFRRLTHVEA